MKYLYMAWGSLGANRYGRDDRRTKRGIQVDETRLCVAWDRGAILFEYVYPSPSSWLQGRHGLPIGISMF